ncbi:MAG: hypothetical protein PVSMB4_08920 [Ktedonobacterales bacterium]
MVVSGIAVGTLLVGSGGGDAFFHVISAGGIALLADVVVLLACGLALLLSPAYITRQGVTQHGEY